MHTADLYFNDVMSTTYVLLLSTPGKSNLVNFYSLTINSIKYHKQQKKTIVVQYILDKLQKFSLHYNKIH